MRISEKDVEYVANLAMLEVGDDEKKALAEQLSRIVEYVEKLNQLDLSAIEPTAQVVTSVKYAIRDDRVAPRTGSADAGRTVKLFKVPKVITER
jgi:aspartyl-tRNA(Asn)/glutamyl-tRNA(Gln) amidotransferase subunit C